MPLLKLENYFLDKKEKIKSDELEKGSLYLITHESNVRTDTFDVALEKATTEGLDVELADLSPVTISKITYDKKYGNGGTTDTMVSYHM